MIRFGKLEIVGNLIRRHPDRSLRAVSHRSNRLAFMPIIRPQQRRNGLVESAELLNT
jgi:hypothetical protein